MGIGPGTTVEVREPRARSSAVLLAMAVAGTHLTMLVATVVLWLITVPDAVGRIGGVLPLAIQAEQVLWVLLLTTAVLAWPVAAWFGVRSFARGDGTRRWLSILVAPALPLALFVALLHVVTAFR